MAGSLKPPREESVPQNLLYIIYLLRKLVILKDVVVLVCNYLFLVAYLQYKKPFIFIFTVPKILKKILQFFYTYVNKS